MWTCRPRLQTSFQRNLHIQCRWINSRIGHSDVQQMHIYKRWWARMDQVTDLCSTRFRNLHSSGWSLASFEYTKDTCITPPVLGCSLVNQFRHRMEVDFVLLLTYRHGCRIPFADLFHGVAGIIKLPSSSYAVTSQTSGQREGELRLSLTFTPRSVSCFFHRLVSELGTVNSGPSNNYA